MPDDKIQDLARIFATLIEIQGAKAAVEALPPDMQFKLNQYFMDELLQGWQADKTDATES